MWCLSGEDLPERHVAQPHRLALPAGEQLDQAPRFGGEPGAAAPGAAARGGEHLGAEHALHFTDAVQAGAVAPADFATCRPDGPGAIDRVEKAQVARPHEERTVPVEPQLVVRLEVDAQRATAGPRLSGRHEIDWAENHSRPRP